VAAYCQQEDVRIPFVLPESVIFAALPQTRGFDSPSSLILKFNPMPAKLRKRAEADERMDTSTPVPGQGWFSFDLRSEADVRDALRCLSRAYQAAGR
jgi:hypothetical protein